MPHRILKVSNTACSTPTRPPSRPVASSPTRPARRAQRLQGLYSELVASGGPRGTIRKLLARPSQRSVYFWEWGAARAS
jgi:hypothetical protein